MANKTIIQNNKYYIFDGHFVIANTELVASIFNNDFETFLIIIEKNPEQVHQSTIDKVTPLMYASENEDISLKFVEALIEAGADMNAQDIKGFTALHFAIRRKNTKCIQVLIAKGANVNLRTDHGYTAFSLLFSGYITFSTPYLNPDEFECVKALIDKADEDTISKFSSYSIFKLNRAPRILLKYLYEKFPQKFPNIIYY